MAITSVVNCKRDRYDIYIGRPSSWGNPYKIGRDGTREEVIHKYREWILTQPRLLQRLPELHGKVLGCWCVQQPVNSIRTTKECHGEILLELLLLGDK
jgi:hypothetical protein